MKRRYLLLLGGLVALTGCALSPLTGSLVSPRDRQIEASERVAEAVQRLKKDGDSAGANQLLADAVRLLEPLGSGAGRVEVARQLMEYGQPGTAWKLLEPLTHKPETQDDPLLWGMLALSAQKAGMNEQQERAQKQASELADAALAQVGKTLPADAADRRKRASLYMSVSRYFTESAPDPQKAIRASEEALRLFESFETLNSLGFTLADQGSKPGDFERAVMLTYKALQQVPDDAEARAVVLDSYGWALYKRGDMKAQDWEGARRVLREAVDLPYENPEIRYHLGVVYGALGLDNEAKLELSRALLLRPGYPEAAQALRRYQPLLRSAPAP
jgi:tetratricopeptide (TPR) repeat protein